MATRLPLSTSSGRTREMLTTDQIDTRLSSDIFLGLITGFQIEYVSGTQVKVNPGAAYIESTKKVLFLSASQTLTPTLAASTWYYIYLYDSGGTPTLEYSTTAPATGFAGTARSKTSDTTKRFIGVFRTNGSSAIHNFYHSLENGMWSWRESIGSGYPGDDFRVGVGITTVQPSTYNVVCTLAAPPICRMVYTRVITNTTTAFAYLYGDNSEMTNTDPTLDKGFFALGENTSAYFFMPVNTSNTFRVWYRITPTTGACYVDIYGFILER